MNAEFGFCNKSISHMFFFSCTSSLVFSRRDITDQVTMGDYSLTQLYTDIIALKTCKIIIFLDSSKITFSKKYLYS